MGKIYFIRKNRILEGEVIGYTKKGAYRVIFKGKEILVSAYKGFKNYEDANKELEKILIKEKHKREKEKREKEYFDKIIELEDIKFRAYKSYIRKEITKQERDKIIKECDEKIDEIKR